MQIFNNWEACFCFGNICRLKFSAIFFFLKKKVRWDPTLGGYCGNCTDSDFARNGLNRRIMSPKEKASLLCRRSCGNFGLQRRQIEILISKFGSFFQNGPRVLRVGDIKIWHILYLLRICSSRLGSAPKSRYSCAVAQILSDPDENQNFGCALPSRFVWTKKFFKIFKF